MRDPLYETQGPKQTVSLTINSDLYAKAKRAGINASRVAEEALAIAYAEKCATALRAELQQDLAAVGSYTQDHGSFADFARAHGESDRHDKSEDGSV